MGRLEPRLEYGLSTEEVKRQIKNELVNIDTTVATRSIVQL